MRAFLINVATFMGLLAWCAAGFTALILAMIGVLLAGALMIVALPVCALLMPEPEEA